MAVKCVSCLYFVGGVGGVRRSFGSVRPRSTVILRSAVQNDLMLRNWRVSRVIAEPP